MCVGGGGGEEDYDSMYFVEPSNCFVAIFVINLLCKYKTN